MTARLFDHLKSTRQRMRQQLQRLQSGELQVLDLTRDPPVDVTHISIERVQELLDDADALIEIYGADKD